MTVVGTMMVPLGCTPSDDTWATMPSDGMRSSNGIDQDFRCGHALFGVVLAGPLDCLCFSRSLRRVALFGVVTECLDTVARLGQSRAQMDGDV